MFALTDVQAEPPLGVSIPEDVGERRPADEPSQVGVKAPKGAPAAGPPAVQLAHQPRPGLGVAPGPVKHQAGARLAQETATLKWSKERPSQACQNTDGTRQKTQCGKNAKPEWIVLCTVS
eukprot:scaffold237222_cov21-Prasinocladus_malaysianus.AAC.1